MIRRLDRYVTVYFLQAYFYCIAGFLSIWFIFDVSDNISTFLDQRISRMLILKYYLAQIPQILVILLPVALLLALLFSLGRMSRSNEIVSMLTAGVSLPLTAPGRCAYREPKSRTKRRHGRAALTHGGRGRCCCCPALCSTDRPTHGRCR